VQLTTLRDEPPFRLAGPCDETRPFPGDGAARMSSEERDENNLPFPAISRVGGHYAESGGDFRSLNGFA
jgi:hypothetical protein